MTRVLVDRGAEVDVVEPYAPTDFAALGVHNWGGLHHIPSERKYDWIFLIEVVEHLPDPVAALTTIGGHLSARGRLLLTTPNAAGWRARREGLAWREAVNPTHLFLFSPFALRSALTRAGYGTVRRLRRPVRYKQRFDQRVALAVLQILGVDGGIRMLAGGYHKEA